MPIDGVSHCSDLNGIADNVLKEGDGFLFFPDDHDARLDYFAEQLQNVDATERDDLVTKILEKDPGATLSWLTSENLGRLVEEGRITELESQAITESVAEAYVNGDIELGDVLGFHSLVGSGAVMANALNPDSAVVADFIDSLANTSSGPEFLEKFASEVFTERLFADPRGFNPDEAGTYAGILLNALEQAGGTASVNAVLSGLPGDIRTSLLEGVSANGLGFNNPDFQGTGVRDPMAIVIDSVSQYGSEQDVVDLVNFVDKHSSGNGFDNHYFDLQNKPYPQRSEALSDLFLAHSDTILDALTTGNEGKPTGAADGVTYVGQELGALSNLFRLTGLNPDNPKAEQVMDSVADYLNERIGVSNKLEGVDDVDGNGVVDHHDLRLIQGATSDIAMITAALQEAVSSGYADLAADNAARDAMIGMLLDVTISAIPILGSKASGPIADAISEALGGLSDGVRDEIAESLANIPEHLLTNAQGQLTDAAKEAVIEALPDDLQYLEGISKDAENFIYETIHDQAARISDLSSSVHTYRAFIDAANP